MAEMNIMRQARGLRLDWPFRVLAVLLLAVFLMGGGSRADIASLPILRPLSALALGYALWGLGWPDLVRPKFLYGMAAAIVGLVLLQLVPLPPALWAALPGRGLIAEIDRAAGLGEIWRPMSVVPSATSNALFSLIPPMAALLLATRLRREEHVAIMLLLLGIGLLSAILAVFQLVGAPDSPLYFYQVTNHGSAVGLFANRNHQAVFLSSLFPLLAVFASARTRSLFFDQRIRLGLALAMGGFLIPLILVTGSRMGLISMAIGLVATPLLYGSGEAAHRGPRRAGIGKGLARSIVAVVVLGLVILTVFFGRAVAIDRIVDPTAAEGVRYRAWGPMISTGMEYFPAGSGFGSFADVFKVSEPHDLLATTIFAHAHSDWLELMITGGLPALLLLGIAIAAFFLAASRWWRRRREAGDEWLMAGAGLWMVLIIAVASGGDYPLRVPSLSCLFCVIVVWIKLPASAGIEGEGV